jgi:hypothetical protein
LNLALNLEYNGVLNVHIWPKIMGKKFGQFGQNWVKSGQTLENFSQPRDSNIFSNKNVFLKLE